MHCSEGRTAEARLLLDALMGDADRDLLGPQTALGLPRRLQAGFLRLAKAEGDLRAKTALQYHLVPPPELLAPLFRTDASDRAAFTEAAQQPVPRLVHQVWIGSAPPVTTRAWAEAAARQGYGYRLWHEDDLAALGLEDDPAYRHMRAKGDLPGAVDVARYHILAREGGIYLDCDWYPARSTLDSALPRCGLTALAEETPRLTGAGPVLLNNSLIATPPGHPALLHLIAALPRVLDLLPSGPAWWVTGPLVFTLTCRRGPVTLADARIVAAQADSGMSEADVKGLAARCDNPGLLIAWKPW